MPHRHALRRIADEAGQRSAPLVDFSCEQAGLAMIHDGRIDAHWRGHHWQAACHILDQFVAAFAPGPRFVGQWHDSDVHRLHRGDFAVFGPGDECQTVESIRQGNGPCPDGGK